MMTDQHMLIIIILCGIVTILVRVIPFMMISRVNLPDVIIQWLSFIPITLFTALVLDGIIQQHEGSVGYILNVPFIIALIPTVLLAIYTRSLTWTILGGIAFIALLRFFL
ncbi:AzlD domain-containing protein [Staphylococcus warneri]|uniref:AzlD domain-containing protein n=1 Tax=Staphylococcus warneri TaxID=1292 RepID=UPI0009D5860F|nr:AzlD domain-containing protein [Staphylococcus warneri]SKR60100.1 Predicted membrane protein [Mycobacteroides abscessus subsp. abscessus]MCR1796515.1 AzlD domain-containing protein [Staphylococcus warneri]MCT2596473.1 AzlD domain-containing protein [Staphylococcus warneri]SUM99577.1 branched-chain amino acid transport family protein [Staphylococcus warneri]VED30581.1 branched-chain amino acid transport family protein [Staphylococcus warneri]